MRKNIRENIIFNLILTAAIAVAVLGIAMIVDVIKSDYEFEQVHKAYIEQLEAERAAIDEINEKARKTAQNAAYTESIDIEIPVIDIAAISAQDEPIYTETLPEEIEEPQIEEVDYSAHLSAIYGNDEYTNDLRYQLSISLMDQGYTDRREWFVINDDDYCAWRYENEPIKGYYQEAKSPLPVRFGDSGVTQEDANYIIECLASMPQGFLQQLANDGWYVELITKDSLNSEYDDSEGVYVAGQTDYNEKSITVNTRETWTIYHEVGHVVSSYATEKIDAAGLHNFSDTGELADLCCHSAFGSLYIYMNPEEQIAESFYDYCWYPREMQTQAPTLYNIFDETVHSFDYLAA